MQFVFCPSIGNNISCFLAISSQSILAANLNFHPVKKWAAREGEGGGNIIILLVFRIAKFLHTSRHCIMALLDWAIHGKFSKFFSTHNIPQITYICDSWRSVCVDACEGFQIQGFDIWPQHTYNTKNNGQLCRLLFFQFMPVHVYMLLQVAVRLPHWGIYLMYVVDDESIM